MVEGGTTVTGIAAHVVVAALAGAPASCCMAHRFVEKVTIMGEGAKAGFSLFVPLVSNRV